MYRRCNYVKMKTLGLACFVLQLVYVFGATLPIHNEHIQDNALTKDTYIGVDRSDVTFRLYTRQNPTQYKELLTGNLNSANVDPTKPFKFIIHGYTDDAGKPWVLSMIDAYLKKGDYNVVGVDWEKPASSLYPTSVAYTRDVGKFLGELIVDLINTLSVPAANIHLIGHSLGSHIAAFAGQTVKAITVQTKIGRITGMDPAGPLFWTNTEDERLSPDDANYVDVIHTDGGKLGYFFECGHADFYPEAGLAPQPGCVFRLGIIDFASCSHIRAYALFTESINSSGFIGRQCADFFAFIGRRCDNNAAAIMGENIEIGTKGRYYLSTNSESPFATNGEIHYRS